MKYLIIALSLLVAAPAFADGRQPTAAQQRDIHRLHSADWRCRDYNADNGKDPAYAVPEEENQGAKKACDRRDELARKLEKQGFCFYKGYNVKLCSNH